MSRLIDADKLIKELNKFVGYDDDGEQCFLLDTKLSTDEVFITIGEQPTVEINQWIPCSERLPKTSWVGGRSEYVQGHCKGYYIPIPVIYDSKNDKWITFGEKEVDVVAWQPLLKLFKEADCK